jgi:hypothetical protein
MNKLVSFINEFRRYNPTLVESILDGYNAIFESVEDEVSNLIDAHLDRPTLDDRIISYLQNTKSNKFIIPDTIEDQTELIKAIRGRSPIPELLSRDIDILSDYSDMTLDEIVYKKEEDKVNDSNLYFGAIINLLKSYNKGKELILSKDSSLNVIIPSIKSLAKEVFDSFDVDYNNVYLEVYKGDDRYNAFTISVNLDDESMQIEEANEESNQETIDAVNALTVDPEKYVNVYSSQPMKVIEVIQSKQVVPKGTFVSDNKEYASKYLQEGRDIISFDIQYKYINPHSQYDWMVNADAPVKSIKFV